MKANGFVYRARMAAMLRFWREQAGATGRLPAALLRDMRGQARTLGRELDRFLKASDLRLEAREAALAPRRTDGADAAWRPSLWRQRQAPTAAADRGQQVLDGETALYHDCPLAEVWARQIANPGPSGQAPFALVTETYAFSGSYLSVSVRLPAQLTTGTSARHILVLDLAPRTEVPLTLLARLNLAQGQDALQLTQTVGAPDVQGIARTEFDLGHAGLGDRDIREMWIDIFFQSPANNRIVLGDLVVARRTRAEL